MGSERLRGFPRAHCGRDVSPCRPLGRERPEAHPHGDGKLRESRQLHSWMGNADEESALDLLTDSGWRWNAGGKKPGWLDKPERDGGKGKPLLTGQPDADAPRLSRRGDREERVFLTETDTSSLPSCSPKRSAMPWANPWIAPASSFSSSSGPNTCASLFSETFSSLRQSPVRSLRGRLAPGETRWQR